MTKWKNEEVLDHKFDYVDIHEFERADCLSRVRYSWVFFVVLKSVLVYVADLWTASALLVTDKWAGAVEPKIPFQISKWIFVGSIVASFVLLTWEIMKANAVISSRDISVAFTNTIASRYYTLMSYAHWCFFLAIRDSQTMVDKIAFFVYFGFKGWKRLLFCDGPRQVINFITLFSLFQDHNFSRNPNAYGTVFRKSAMGVMAFTVVIFLISICLLLLSSLLYLPLLCKIQGNLKEYCCHIIDKRISKLLNKQRARRIKKNTEEQKMTIQPTLPEIDDTPQPKIQNYPTVPDYKSPVFQSPPPLFDSSYTSVPQNNYNDWHSAKGSVSIPVSIPIPSATEYKPSYEMGNMSNPYHTIESPISVDYYASLHLNKMQNLQFSNEPSLPSQYNYDPNQDAISVSPLATPKQFYPSEEIPPEAMRMNAQHNPNSSSSATVISSNRKMSSDTTSVRTNSPPLLARYGQDRTNRRPNNNYMLQGGRRK